MRLHHGTRMERRDLVVVTVGHDHRLRGVSALDLTHEFGRDTQGVQALQIISRISTQSGHRQRRATQHFQAVGDVAGATAKVAAQSRHQKRHVQDVQLVRQDLLSKSAFKIHDGVKRERAANQRCHTTTFKNGGEN